jgi:hypothetical protein
VADRAGTQGENADVEPLRDDDPAGIGNYRLLCRLGAGGMGQVYLGESPAGLQVAVKVIKPSVLVHVQRPGPAPDHGPRGRLLLRHGLHRRHRDRCRRRHRPPPLCQSGSSQAYWMIH